MLKSVHCSTREGLFFRILRMTTVAQSFLSALLRLCFFCRSRTRWRTARPRSRRNTLSYWRTCRTPSARWKNRLPPLSTSLVVISEPSTAESHSTSSYSRNTPRAPLCSFFVSDCVSVCVCVCVCARLFMWREKRKMYCIHYHVLPRVGVLWILCMVADRACVCGFTVCKHLCAVFFLSLCLHDFFFFFSCVCV